MQAIKNYFVCLSIFTMSLNMYSQVIHDSLNISNIETIKIYLDKWALRFQGIHLGDNVGITIGVYEYGFGENRFLEMPLLLKVNITDNLSLLGGTTIDLFQTQDEIINQIDATLTLGVQYHFNNDLYIQGLFNYQLINTNNPYNYKAFSPSSFSIGSGFKF